MDCTIHCLKSLWTLRKTGRHFTQKGKWAKVQLKHLRT